MSQYNSMIAWDSATKAWVPTAPPYLSPDGTRFAAPITRSTIDIVDARTGATVTAIPLPNRLDTVIGYTQKAIYLIGLANYGGAPPPGLWKIDTSSWKVSQVSSQPIYWEVVDDTAAWGVSMSFNALERLDLSTDSVAEVHPAGPDFYVILAGFAGSGVLVVNDSALKVAQIIGRNGSIEQIDIPAPLNGASINSSTFQDEGEILFPSTAGVFAFDAVHGFQELAANPNVFRVLGPCTGV